MKVVSKEVKLNLVGLDGNAFAILGAFKSQAKKEKWSREEIDLVINEAMKGDYDHLLATIIDHCDAEELYEDIEEDDDDYFH